MVHQIQVAMTTIAQICMGNRLHSSSRSNPDFTNSAKTPERQELLPNIDVSSEFYDKVRDSVVHTKQLDHEKKMA